MNPKPIHTELLQYIRSDKFKNHFWSKVSIKGQDDCWAWLGFVMPKSGYGQVKAKGRKFTAHRVAWVISNGRDVPEAMNILHSCVDSKSCCNPNHLRPGTQVENTKDAIDQGRFVCNARKGQECGRAKLTDESVLKMRALYRTGHFTQTELATMFGVKYLMAHHIINRHNWKHLP